MVKSQTDLSHDEFFAALNSLFKACHAKNHGSIHLTQKRLTYGNSPSETAPSDTKVADNPLWDLDPPNPLPVLIRASNGKTDKSKKEKISTVVRPDELEGFYLKYAEVSRKAMERLEPRDRSKKKDKKKKDKKKGKGKKDA